MLAGLALVLQNKIMVSPAKPPSENEVPGWKFSLDHLSPTEFEEFCYELLQVLGCINLSWRKGTGLNASPSDRGRDIECTQKSIDVDGAERHERWFVECKHYTRGVPPNELEAVLNWASVEAADVVLIIASNFLSNPAKDFLDRYHLNRRPPFRIKVWERPELERLSIKMPTLLGKFRISPIPEFARLLHVGHLFYINSLPINTLDQLFQILDGLEAKHRDSMLSWIYDWVGNPRHEPESWPPKTTRDPVGPAATYTSFREACYRIHEDGILDETLLVQLVVSRCLSGWFCISDITSVDRKIDELKRMNRFLEEGQGKTPEGRRGLQGLMRFNAERIHKIEEDTHRHYEDYKAFCNDIVVPLLLDPGISDLVNSKEFQDLARQLEEDGGTSQG